MTKDELEAATIAYGKMRNYKRLATSIKEARESDKITSMTFYGSNLRIDIYNNGKDFWLLLTKIEEELKRLHKEHKEEFEKL